MLTSIHADNVKIEITRAASLTGYFVWLTWKNEKGEYCTDYVLICGKNAVVQNEVK